MTSIQRYAPVLLVLAFFSASGAQLLCQAFIAPSPAELSMTSQPEVPGAAAVYLNREESTDDLKHVLQIYERIKVLTEAGKEYANVEIPFQGGDDGMNLYDVAGRTIHPDGTIVPLTAKPLKKVVEKGGGYKIMEGVFTMPAVDVGSIIEYRYRLGYSDYQVRSPEWYVQSTLFTRNAHYMWTPTGRDVISQVDGANVTSTVAAASVLPPGTTLQTLKMPQFHYELAVHDIPPIPHEEYMPPLNSVSYRVMFYYTSYRSADEFWKSAGKRWSKAQDKFIGPGNGVKSAVEKMAAPGDTADQKLRKFYAAVMEMENTDYTRQRSVREDKGAGLREVKSTDDILARRRGSSDQLADLFVAMARAAGLKAYAVGVADRSQRILLPNYLSLSQLDDVLAVVSVDGKDQFFDPGSRYCSYGHLAWQHSPSSALRQTDDGTKMIVTPSEGYKTAHITRIADLTLDEEGKATGKMVLTYTGDPALYWRHVALRGDDESLKHSLRESAEKMLPGGMDVKVTSVAHGTEYEQPLTVTVELSGAIGSAAGKRLLIPAALFEVNTKPYFPEEKRELMVDMHYADFTQDAVRIKLPATLAVESFPESKKNAMPQQASYTLTSEKSGGSITMRRDLAMGENLFYPKDYAGLRTFYNKLQADDQESVVLVRGPVKTN